MTVGQWRELCRRDIAANKGYPKSVVILLGLRTAALVRSFPGPLGRVAYLVVGTAYRLFAEWLLGVEIPVTTSIGPGLRLRHAVGVVVNPASVIGADVMLRHGVTLGNRREAKDCPRIGAGVEIGVGATIIGAITVGAGAKIGAGAVVLHDVPAGAIVHVPAATPHPVGAVTGLALSAWGPGSAGGPPSPG